MKNKITVIFGGTFGLYHHTLREIENKFQCEIIRTSPFKLKTKIYETTIDFYLCNSPTRDKNYYIQKKYLQSSQWKELIPPPTDEVVKKINNSKIVLFFGYCGVFKGKKSVYTPEIFKEIFFNTYKIMKVDESKIKVENEIKIKNILKSNIDGENAIVVTSNLVLAPYHKEPESKNRVIKIAEKLSKFGDVVEKESYQIAKHFGNKTKLGIYLQASDVLSNKRHMLHHKGMEINRKKFNNNVIKAIKFVLKN